MKGDFTRFTHDPGRHYSRVLKQQGRVDVDADWNELAEIFTHLERTEAVDVIGRCGVPEHDAGFGVEIDAAGRLTLSPGRLYVDGIQCSLEAADPVPLDRQPDLPGYAPPIEDGVYIAYADVWERHVTHVEDPEIREVALGGPDTATRVRTMCQVRLHRLGDDQPLADLECQPYPAVANTAKLAAQTLPDEEPSNPCVVPASAGYRGLENRLYRVEIHDHGRDADGNQVRPATFKWSRDNGAVLLPVAAIAADTITVARLGPDEVLTVHESDWVEVLGDATELEGRAGTLTQVEPGGIDGMKITLVDDVSAHAGETHLKVRRWDHHATAAVALVGGALPIQGEWFELEDGVQVGFDIHARYDIGDYWVIPARTREGTVLWPRLPDPLDATKTVPAELPRFGIVHHHCTLALLRRADDAWTERRDCRNRFPPLTEIRDGACCITVDPGEDVQAAIDDVIDAGGGSVCLCRGVHEIDGPLWLRGARNVRLSGENTSTVLRLRATNGAGGIVVERGERVSIENMLVVSDDVAALIDVRPDADFAPSRRVALRRLTLLNRSNDERRLSCGARLSHTRDVRIEECRIAAEVGVLSLWGRELPELDGPGSGASTGFVTVDLEDQTVGREFRVGDAFVASGIQVTGRTFYWSNGKGYDGGFARVEAGQQAGGSGRDLQVNNINLRFGLQTSYGAVRVAFGDYGGNINLRVNGELRNVNSVASLDGQTIGGVRIGVTQVAGVQTGTLRLDADTQRIAEFEIGGQELWIDDVVFRGGEAPPQLPGEYGDGVSDLCLHGTQIAYREYGVLAARAERWEVDDSTIASSAPEAWDTLAASWTDGEELRAYAALQSGLEAVFVPAAEALGVAIAAFLWRDCTVRSSRLSGTYGALCWWWIRGAVTDCEVTGSRGGLFGTWIHAVDWTRDRITTKGVALGFCGSHRACLAHNRIEALVGVTNIPLERCFELLEMLGTALVHGYGSIEATAKLAVWWMATEDSVDLMGLRGLLDALQAWLDAHGKGGVPVAMLLARLLPRWLEAPPDIPLPVIHLRVAGNEVAARLQCIALDGFVPLGSLRIGDNRLHTITGQALRLAVEPLAANAHLLVLLWRAVFDAVREAVDAAIAGATNDPELRAVLQAGAALLQRWQAGAEAFFALDFRIESNTIRSLRTAIEFDLYEVAVLDNHITLQERPAADGGKDPASLSGTVAQPGGGSIPGATVRVDGTEFSATTDAKATYRIDGIPAGQYLVRASHPGFREATRTVTLGAGQDAKLDFVLERVQLLSRVRWSGGDAAVARQPRARPGDNRNTERVLTTLQQNAAFEPVGLAMREGVHRDAGVYAAQVLSPGGPLGSAGARTAAADAVAAAGGLAESRELAHASAAVATALRADDRTALAALLPAFLRALGDLTDSGGILARGVGGRIVGNQVLVPEDGRPETRALGGIQLSVSLIDLMVTALLGRALLEALGSGSDELDRKLRDPLLGITDTLVDNNEVSGGFGHGISIQGAAGAPDALADLRVRGNQVRGVAGAGILIDEHAYVVGGEITGNHVADCGQVAGFSERRGGIVVDTAALCRLHGNHVERCRDGIALETVYGARLDDNHVLANGVDDDQVHSGIELTDAYGGVAVNDNVISHNLGVGLHWANSALSLPKFVLDLANLYLGTNKAAGNLVAEEQAVVSGNVFESDASFRLFELINLTEVGFIDNTCRGASTSIPLGQIKNVERGVVSNNRLSSNAGHTISIKKMRAGVIVGNVGNKPIDLVGAPPGVQHGLNVPPVI